MPPTICTSRESHVGRCLPYLPRQPHSLRTTRLISAVSSLLADAGQYVPNIAHFILNNEPFSTSLNLKGLALGNACWGGNATHVNCNGENAKQHMAEIYHGKGLSSETNYADIQSKCDFPNISPDCEEALRKQSEQVGPHNIVTKPVFSGLTRC